MLCTASCSGQANQVGLSHSLQRPLPYVPTRRSALHFWGGPAWSLRPSSMEFPNYCVLAEKRTQLGIVYTEWLASPAGCYPSALLPHRRLRGTTCGRGKSRSSRSRPTRRECCGSRTGVMMVPNRLCPLGASRLRPTFFATCVSPGADVGNSRDASWSWWRCGDVGILIAAACPTPVD